MHLETVMQNAVPGRFRYFSDRYFVGVVPYFFLNPFEKLT